MKKLTVRDIALGGMLLAIMIVSQFAKNLSVYITGPIVNTVIIIATLSLGPIMGIILSIIAPISSLIITQSPLIMTIPLIIPAIMIGNIILAVAVFLFSKEEKHKWKLPLGLIIGSVFKAAFMAAVISKCLLVYSHTQLPEMVINTAKLTFSVTQLITALIGSLLALLIWMPLKKMMLTK